MMIDGMTCGHCSSRVEKALNALVGVIAKVNLAEKKAFITMSTDVADSTLRTAVEDAGYDVVSIVTA